MLLGQLGMGYLCRWIAAHRRSEEVRGREQDGKGIQRQRSQAIVRTAKAPVIGSCGGGHQT
jgi:hypothetical protein